MPFTYRCSFRCGKLENCQIIALSFWSEYWSIMRMLIHFERWPLSPWLTCFLTTWRASTCTTGPSQNPSTAQRLSRWYNLCEIRHCWQWIVVKKPVYCSLAQLTPFRALLGDKGQLLGQNLPENKTQGCDIESSGGNFRPVQKTGAKRRVLDVTTSTKTSDSTMGRDTWPLLITFVTCFVTTRMGRRKTI